LLVKFLVALLVTLSVALLAGGCAVPGQKPSPMVCPSAPGGCAKEGAPWYHQDVTAMIPPPPIEPPAPLKQTTVDTTNDGVTPAPEDASPPPVAAEPVAGPVVSSFAATAEDAPGSAPSTPPAESTAATTPTASPQPGPRVPQATQSAPPIDGTLQLPSDALFGLGSATLGAGGRRSLDALADRLHGTAYTHIHVIAHTDRSGQAMTNLKLSWQRARIVRDHLASRGIPGDALDHEGRGSRDARIDPDRCGSQKVKRIQCLAPDRRVDIAVTQRKVP